MRTLKLTNVRKPSVKRKNEPAGFMEHYYCIIAYLAGYNFTDEATSYSFDGFLHPPLRSPSGGDKCWLSYSVHLGL